MSSPKHSKYMHSSPVVSVEEMTLIKNFKTYLSVNMDPAMSFIVKALEFYGRQQKEKYGGKD